MGPILFIFYSGALPDSSYAHFWWIKFITIFPPDFDFVKWKVSSKKTFGLKKKKEYLEIDVFGPRIKCRFYSLVLPGINSFSFFFFSRQVRFETLEVDYIHWHREKKKKKVNWKNGRFNLWELESRAHRLAANWINWMPEKTGRNVGTCVCVYWHYVNGFQKHARIFFPSCHEWWITKSCKSPIRVRIHLI